MSCQAISLEVDEAGAGVAAGMPEGHGALEDVIVLAAIGHGGIGPGDFQKIAEFRDETSTAVTSHCFSPKPRSCLDRALQVLREDPERNQEADFRFVVIENRRLFLEKRHE
jgi:hypothetical protein